MDDFRLSFEFFPTKTEEGTRKLYNTRDQLAELNPDFFSVTYGAGGSTRSNTIDIVTEINKKVLMPHLTYLVLAKAKRISKNYFNIMQTVISNVLLLYVVTYHQAWPQVQENLTTPMSLLS